VLRRQTGRMSWNPMCRLILRRWASRPQLNLMLWQLSIYLMRRVLRNRGIALQWIGSGTETEYKLIMRTFLSVFPHTTLWQNGSLMVGADRPLVLEEDAFLRKQGSPETKLALDAMGLTSFDALLGRYNAGPAELKAFVGEGPILTDDRPLTEYFLALPQNDRPVDLSAVRGTSDGTSSASWHTPPASPELLLDRRIRDAELLQYVCTAMDRSSTFSAPAGTDP
jgi:hypothetical protein